MYIVSITPTGIMHRTCYKKRVLSMTVATEIKLRIFDQIVTSVSFEPKIGNPPPPRNAETLKTIMCQTAPLAKVPPGVLIYS